MSTVLYSTHTSIHSVHVLCDLMLMRIARLARLKRRTDVRQLNDCSEPSDMLARPARNAELAIASQIDVQIDVKVKGEKKRISRRWTFS